MAITRVETALTWNSAASQTLSNNTTYYASDAFTFDATCVGAAIQVSADNAGTPAAGDVVYFYLSYTTGDLLGNTGDDYDTDEHSILLGVLDTVAANTPGEDPARKTLVVPTVAPKGAKLLALAPQSASRNIVIRARLTEQRAA